MNTPLWKALHLLIDRARTSALLELRGELIADRPWGEPHEAMNVLDTLNAELAQRGIIAMPPPAQPGSIRHAPAGVGEGGGDVQDLADFGLAGARRRPGGPSGQPAELPSGRRSRHPAQPGSPPGG